MRKITLPAPGKFKIINEESPLLRPHSVKVKVSACGVCGSDIAQWQGHRDDLYFGHEFTGVVTEVGKGVQDLKEGMRVTTGIVGTCGRCWNCRNGLPNYCRNLNDILWPGGFSEETIVEHSDSFRFLYPLPIEVDDITGTLHETVGCALRVTDLAELKQGQSVIVFGMGAIGAITAEILQGLGAGVVIGVDLNPNRLRESQKLKVDHIINRKDEDWLDQIYKLVGFRGADLIIEATGSPHALSDAFKAARPGATVVIGSVYHQLANDFDLLPIMRKELQIVGAKGSYPYMTSTDRSIAMETLTSGLLSTDQFFGVYSPDQALAAFTASMEGKHIKSVISFR